MGVKKDTLRNIVLKQDDEIIKLRHELGLAQYEREVLRAQLLGQRMAAGIMMDSLDRLNQLLTAYGIETEWDGEGAEALNEDVATWREMIRAAT